MMTNAVLMLSGACIGASLAGLWWMRELRHYWKVSDEAAKQTKASYEREIEAYRGHINRLHRRLGMELIDEQGYLN